MKVLTSLPLRSFSTTSGSLYPRRPPTAPRYPLPDHASSSSASTSSRAPPSSPPSGPSWYTDGPASYSDPSQPSTSTRKPLADSPPADLTPGRTAPPAWFLPSTSPSSLSTTIAQPLRRPSFLPAPPRTSPAPAHSVPPPPHSLPLALHPLWKFLHTTHLVENESVRFFDTKKPAPKTIPIPEYPPRQGKRLRGPVDGGAGIGGMEVGGWWDWVVVCQVEGRGVGEVMRVEGALREWLDRNPVTLNGTSEVSTKVKRNAKTEPKTEWGLIDTEVGLVVHVMTAAARARWALEGIWSDPDA